MDDHSTLPPVTRSPVYCSTPGLSKHLVEEISAQKHEPAWMKEFRLNALAQYESMPLPAWGADLAELEINDISCYVKPLEDQKRHWADVPDEMKKTFEELGIPQAEQTLLAGVGAQFDSEVIYKNLKKEWADQGVIFTDIHAGLAQFPEIFKKYFATIVPPDDNKFAALNSALWSGGSFVYVPAGIQLTLPLQAYFRINTSSMGQFERTLIIAERGSSVHYVEGCSAPLYSSSSLHAAVVEVIAHEGAHVQYTTIQNWATNVYNLVTKRAVAYANSRVIWVDGNFGSKATMKYPCVILKEPGAKAEIISLAVARAQQHQDSGAKVIHLAPLTASSITAKSISQHGGRSSYRGLVKVVKGAEQVRARVRCDALLLDDESRSDTYPTMQIAESMTDIGHEASVSKIQDEHLIYLMSRGINEHHAHTMIVTGFIDPFVKLLPLEYAVEINRLINHQMKGSIG